MKNVVQFFREKANLFLGLLLMLVSGILHGYNMLGFPFFENDEGTYLAQAWSFLSQGQLAPYTYWYDHAPFGWIFTSLWLAVTGGLFTFGFSLNSARIFMLVIHILNTGLLYGVSQKVTRSKVASLFTIFFFAVSPLAVYFQRRLLLDNLMVFWILISLLLSLSKKTQLRYFLGSAVAFGLAVLTKENAIFFLPVLLVLTAKNAHDHHRTIAVIKWLCLAAAVISVYPLYALLKGEFFPEGSIFSPPHPHVSLLGTLAMQASRGSGLAFWQTGSDFLVNLAYWMRVDWSFMASGMAAVALLLLTAFKSQRSRVVLLLLLPQLVFLMSGKLVINFYIVSLIPFLSLAIGMAIAHFTNLLQRLHVSLAFIATLAVLGGLSYYYAPLTTTYLTKDETAAQKEAVTWIRENIESEKNISIDFYSYLDLTYSPDENAKTFKNADWFWKVELDPDIRVKKLSDDYRNLDYVMITAEAQRQIPYFDSDTSLIKQAMQHSHPISHFSLDPTFPDHFVMKEQTMPNGDWVVMYKQEGQDLEKAWKTYTNKFLKPEGYILPPEQSNYVTSEGQSYALLRAVWMNDQQTFDTIYAWTKSNMQLKKSKLFGWNWQVKTRSLLDEGDAPDANQDIALALLFASKRWNNQVYYEEARAIINDIWKINVYEQGDLAMITAGSWAVSSEYVTLNPSYVAPYAYRIFAEVDPDHDWDKVVDTSYTVLRKCSFNLLDKNYSTGLPPEWCRFQKEKGMFIDSQAPQPTGTEYGFNAFRLPWKVYLDYQWNNEPRALEYLKGLDFVVEKYRQGQLTDVISHDGISQTKSTRYAYIMNLPIFMATDETLAQQMYLDHFQAVYHEEDQGAYWYEGDEYYLQNWAWFAAGIYQGDLKNLYK